MKETQPNRKNKRPLLTRGEFRLGVILAAALAGPFCGNTTIPSREAINPSPTPGATSVIAQK